jgi:HAD superfamily hydrolase (TIGR01490 family)
MPETKNKALAIFDLDQTLLYGDSFRLFLWYFYVHRPHNLRYFPALGAVYLLRKCRLISLQRAKELCLIGLRGMDRDAIADVGKAFFHDVLKNRFSIKAIDRVLWHRSRQDRLYLATSSPDIYIKPIVQWLQMDGYVASELHYREERFTGVFYGADCLGEEKLRRLAQLLPAEQWRHSYAYSDSLSDQPLLHAVKYGIITSDTEKNTRQAHRFGWMVTDFAKDDSFRKRVEHALWPTRVANQ